MIHALLLALPLMYGDPAAASKPAQEGAAAEVPEEPDRRTPVVRVVLAARPAVVHIRTTRVVESTIRDWVWAPRGRRLEEVDALEGSGVVIDAMGYIVTNEHVVRDAGRLVVRFDQRVDPKEYAAAAIAVDRENDLALLKIETREPCHAVRLGRSDDLLIGETVVAIGNALGEGLNAHASTVSSGILSAVDRDLHLPREGRSYRGLLQTDAAINPGNSGGPLLNLRGELIGINTAILPEAQGIGFAIPVDRVRDILHTNLFNLDRSGRFWLGMRLEEGEGVSVASVDPGGPAAEAGLRERDRIVAVDGSPVSGTLELSKRLLPRSAGERVELRVRRGEEESSLRVILGSAANRYLRERLGFSLEAASLRGERALRVAGLVPKSRADQIGFRVGDLLLGVGLPPRPQTMVAVQAPEDLAGLLEGIPPRGVLKVLLLRGEDRYSGEVVLR
ncbi:MAG TPA: trypsin-like peptidase domain-containing protein [Planctomycetota bacterium]|nr:trypsin-like peptidase domain-containing protein [Planctomycetota bacterium]